MRLFLCFWVYLSLLNCSCGWVRLRPGTLFCSRLGSQMVALLHDHGVDKHVRVVVVLVAIVAVDGDKLNELADLRGSQAATAVLEHHLLHLLGKRLDRRGDLLDDGALLAQTTL